MSAWRGWNEQQVRGSSSSKSGFTAINAGIAEPVAPIEGANVSKDTRNEDRLGSQPETALLAVSQYLGRGDAQQNVSLMTQSKGKKRASAASDKAPAPKRSKSKTSNTVNDDMPIIKSNITADISRSAEGQNSKRRKTKKSASKPSSRAKELCEPVSVSTPDSAVEAVTAVCIYGQTTSIMQAQDSTSLRTSMEHVKANHGQGYTQYQSSSVQDPSSSSVRFSQPWLSKSITGPTKVQLPSTEYADQISEASNTGTVDELQKRRPSRKAKSFAKERNSYLLRQQMTDSSAVVEPVQNMSDQRSLIIPTKNHLNGRHPTLERQRGRAPSLTFSDQSEFSELDEDTLTVLERSAEINVSMHTPPARKYSQNIREVDEDDDYGGALLSAEDHRLLAKFKLSENAVQPIVRIPFQSAILDRSPIFGASNATLLRTCFRLGEALNTGCHAVRNNKNVVIELYARVTSSWREDRKQHFVFKDMYHEKPPFLNGTFELWNQASLWDLDSRVFLGTTGHSTLCRAIGRMRRNEQEWKLEILSIWEADTSDIEFAAGLYTDDAENEFQW